MTLFSLKNGKLERINKISFKLEKDIQKLTEENLNEIFGLEFVKSEFQLNKLRIDTLAFDNETNSFVIIEYKKDRNFSVIDQGYAYLALLLNNKSDFILEYNEHKDDFLRKKDIDWSQSRIIFIAPQFTRYQQQAIEFKDLPIELWEISKFTNSNILFNQLKSSDTSESINTITSKSEVITKVSKEVKTYTEEDHIHNALDDVKELYEDIKGRILNLSSDIEARPTKLYVAFVSNGNFIYVFIKKSQINFVLNLRKGELKDPENIAKDISEIGHQGYGDYRIILRPGDDLDYMMNLIKQAYKKNTI